MNKKILFLTGCVNPNGMAYTALQDKDIRLKQYITAINWYLANTELPIVFVENTNFDILPFLDIQAIGERLECLTFNGNEYDKNLGKGYGEGLIIKYALKHSRFLKKDSVIIKITGRLILTNISKLIHDYNIECRGSSLIMCDVNRKLTVAFSRVIFMPFVFATDYLAMEVGKINDSRNYDFECALATAIAKSITDERFTFKLFKRPYVLEGISGTNATPIKNKSLLVFTIKNILFHLHLWGK